MAAFNLKFQHECEEFQEYNGERDNRMKFEECKKNPGHTHFIPVCDLKMEDLPSEFRTEEGMRYIQYRCDRVVKINTAYISEDRQDVWYGRVSYPYSDCKGSDRLVRCGTGFIRHVKMYEDKPCQCKECKNSTRPKIGYMKVRVRTARHVVFDKSEAIKTTVECFYDTPDKTEVVLLHGCDSYWNSDYGPDNDNITLFCYTHDKEVMDKLNNMIGSDIPRLDDGTGLKTGFAVSHPHGVHKQISFGHTRFIIYSIRKDLFPKHPGFVQCRLKRNPSSIPDVPISQCPEGKIDNEENKLYLENVTGPSMIQPGIEYLLSDTLKICLPSHHGYLFHWMFGDVDWHDIPEGGGYIVCNGTFVHFPQGMEIRCRFDYQITSTYDIPTCPGSSGARVYIDKDGVGIFYRKCVHSGEDKVLGNTGFHGYF